MAGRPKTTTAKKPISNANVDSTADKTTATVTTEKREYSKKVQIPQDYEIPVKSNVQGILVYTSRKTGYTVEWGEMGDVAYIEYSELVAMRNTAKKFYEDNWVIIEDADDYTAEQVLYTLGVDRYYQGAGMPVDDIFNLNTTELRKLIPTCSSGYKKTIAARAMALMGENDTRLDSNSKVKALEELLGVKFDNEI